MHVAGNEHFLTPCPTIPSIGKRYDRESEHRAWVRGQISLDRLLRVFFVD